MIRYENVTKTYPARAEPVLVDFDLEIEEGTFCVLLGRSGSGKTTALRMPNRMVDPTSGRVLVAGTDVRETDPIALRRKTGYVLQRIGLLPHFSVQENVALVPRLEGWSPARTRERVDELLELVGLEPDLYRARMPNELSGGQQQRVGVARALAAKPRVLLMDEPFGALDPLTRVELRREVGALHRRLGLTTLMVTHDVVEALLLADRIVILDDGRIAQAGAPADVVARPASDFVRQTLSSPKVEIDKLEDLFQTGDA